MPRLIDSFGALQRRDLLVSFMQDVVVPQRARLIAYAAHTRQSAQVDSDGYLGQIIAAIVLGVPGNNRRGKSGSHPGDLADGTEVKSTSRAEQMNGMEDSHINFGQIVPAKLRELSMHGRVAIVHSSYDALGRFKIEVLTLDVAAPAFIAGVEAFLGRSRAKRPQLQPRLYPDGVRDRLQMLPGHFEGLGARLVARAVVNRDGGVVVDKWSPGVGLDLTECLDLAPRVNVDHAHYDIANPGDADEFFHKCMIQYRKSLIPYCALTAHGQNVGFGNLAQHLVSVVTGIPGSGSGARGPDLQGNGEIKLAMGERGDPLGTEDFPRLNLQSNVDKLLSWQRLFPVRIVCDDVGLAVQVMEFDIDEFRAQVSDYFGDNSLYASSQNMQYHAPKTFGDTVFTGKRGDGGQRTLAASILYAARETTAGDCVRC